MRYHLETATIPQVQLTDTSRAGMTRITQKCGNYLSPKIDLWTRTDPVKFNVSEDLPALNSQKFCFEPSSLGKRLRPHPQHSKT